MCSLRIWALSFVLLAATASADEALDSQLVDAVSARNTALVSELLDKGASPDARGYSEMTALMTAASTGDLAMVDLLLAKGARLDAESSLGDTALTSGISHKAVVERLLAAGADINRPNRSGETPLMAAAENGELEVIRLLLARGADPRVRSNDGEGVLGKALGNLHKARIMPIFRRLLAAGAPVDTRNFAGQPLFVTAVVARQEEAARELLARGADPWVKAGDGTTALDAVVSDVWVSDGIMRLLLSLRPSTDVLNHALHSAARNDGLRAVLWLQKAGADLASTVREETVLGAAVRGRAWSVTRELLRRGVSANVPASDGMKPLELAMMRGDLEMVRLLLRSGADPNARGREGEPLLVTAIITEKPEYIELMVVAGARTNITVSGTPLKKIVSRWEDPKMVAAIHKSPTPQAKAELGLSKADDDALFKAIAGSWKDADDFVTTVYRPDGTYTSSYSLVGLTKTESGFWTVDRGDLVIDARASRELPPAITPWPIMRMTEGFMTLRRGSDPVIWKRAGR